MKYLCLVYADEAKLHSLPESPDDAECFAYATSLVERGCQLAGQALEPVATATTVRVRGGKVSVTDGPFAETKEQLGGYYIVDAADIDEAVAMARDLPIDQGSIEVRPIMPMG